MSFAGRPSRHKKDKILLIVNMIFIKVVGQFPFFGIQIYIMHFFNCQIWKRTCYVQFYYFQKTHFGKISSSTKIGCMGKKKHCLSSSFARILALLKTFIYKFWMYNDPIFILLWKVFYNTKFVFLFCFVFVLCTICCQFFWFVIFWLLLRYSLTFISFKFCMNFPLHCSKSVQQIRHVEQIGNVCKYRIGINNTN